MGKKKKEANELIKITENDGKSVVSARELHDFLEVKTRFNDWILRRIDQYDLIENIDYVSLTQNRVSGGLETEYALSVDVAKELSMVENNEKGKQARRYFLNCEKVAKEAKEGLKLLTTDTDRFRRELNTAEKLLKSGFFDKKGMLDYVIKASISCGYDPEAIGFLRTRPEHIKLEGRIDVEKEVCESSDKKKADFCKWITGNPITEATYLAKIVFNYNIWRRENNCAKLSSIALAKLLQNNGYERMRDCRGTYYAGKEVDND